MTKNRNNSFDVLIIIFISLQSLGLIGGALQPVRIFSILLLFFVFFALIKGKLKGYFYEFLVFFIWIFYGLFTLIWTPDFDAGYKEIIVIFVNSIGFFALLALASFANNPQESIIKGWKMLFLILLPIALVELIADRHLPLSIQEEGNFVNMGGGLIVQRRFASVTFGNLNALNTVLAYVIPFLFAPLLDRIPKQKRWFSILLLLCFFYIIISNSSRGALFALCLVSSMFILKYTKDLKKLIGIIILVIIGCAGLLYLSPKFYEVIFLRLTEQSLSDSGRSLAMDAGISELVKSGFFGIGAGGFMKMMESYKADILPPHNIFLEISVQYGLIVFILFMSLGFRIWKRSQEHIEERNKFIIKSGLFIFPIVGIINSGYLLNIWIWMFLASLYIFADKKLTI
ncbi:O-antigen ligase family protein [Sphingobacterium siyangense]|uniref:O-antigen ligase family protein n=1 Tax=Sphingobacterium siyangense TaxID=459529 RepID=UPI003DA1F39D